MPDWERRELTDVVDAVRTALNQGVVRPEHSEPWLQLGRTAKLSSRRIDLGPSVVRELKSQVCQQCKQHELFPCRTNILLARHCALLQLAA